MRRRHFLAGLTGLALTDRALAACPGPSVPAVTGPFPPVDFRDRAAGRANPGARLTVPGEHDLDLIVRDGVELGARGQVVVIRGQLLTTDCNPAAGARVELWQADAAGHYNHENERRSVKASDLDAGFAYWGSTTADAEGRFVLRTIVPGAYPAGGDWWRPPHLHWSLTLQGRPKVTTQSYFDGDVLDGIAEIRRLNAADLILHQRSGFDGGLSGNALTEARKRALRELVVPFAAKGNGAVEGAITLHV